MAIVLDYFEYMVKEKLWIGGHIWCRMDEKRRCWPSSESTWANTKFNDWIFNMHPTYLEIVSPVCWNRSPTCPEVKPVTQVYRKMANCSSKVMNFESPCPMWCKVEISCWKMCFCTPSSVRMHLGWPWRSSSTQAWPDSIDVWYGCLTPRCIARNVRSIVGKTMLMRIFNTWESCCWTIGPITWRLKGESKSDIEVRVRVKPEPASEAYRKDLIIVWICVN